MRARVNDGFREPCDSGRVQYDRVLRIASKRIARGSKRTKDESLPPPTSTTPATMHHVAPRHKSKTAMQQPIALAGAAHAYKRKRIRRFVGEVIIDISVIIP